MRRRTPAILGAILAVVAAGFFWQGCGGDDTKAATFTGNVSSVSPTQASIETPNRWLARAGSFLLPKAVAQASCPAPHVLVCASNGVRSFCKRVGSESCNFSISIFAVNDFAQGSISFVDDANEDGNEDSGEAEAILFQPLGRVCNGSVVTLTDVDLNFTNGIATAASIEKDPDTCREPTPTRTPTPGGVPPTATPTMYAAARSLQGPPSSMLAFLSGAGVVGLILPRRWRSRRRK